MMLDPADSGHVKVIDLRNLVSYLEHFRGACDSGPAVSDERSHSAARASDVGDPIRAHSARFRQQLIGHALLGWGIVPQREFAVLASIGPSVVYLSPAKSAG